MVIPIAIIGLSSTERKWAANAHLPYLQSSRGRDRYKIVALCNSSVESAKKAIETYQLSPDTKAYGDPQALAADPDVKLVVCCTRVDKHYDTLLPSIKAGKDVYLEWPIAHGMDRIEEMVSAARAAGIQTAIGLQGRYAPVIQQLRKIVVEGRIGKVLSSELRAAGASLHPHIMPTYLEYFTDKAIGGNLFTIFYGHLYDQVQYVLGEVTHLSGHTQVQRPNLKLSDDPAGHGKDITSDVPDLIVSVDQLQASETAVEGATVLSRMRLGAPHFGEPALTWTIYGEKGEVRLVAENSTTLQAHGYDKPVRIVVHHLESGKVGEVGWEWTEWQCELPVVARSVGTLYENLADNGEVPTFEEAFHRHQQLWQIF